MLRGQASFAGHHWEATELESGKDKAEEQETNLSRQRRGSQRSCEGRENVDTPTYQRKQVPTPAQHASKQQAQVKAEPEPDAASDAFIRSNSQMLRRSPRKAQVVAQPSAAPDCPLCCPVCSKTLPASMLEINRHIGNVPISAYSIAQSHVIMMKKLRPMLSMLKQPSKCLLSLEDHG